MEVRIEAFHADFSPFKNHSEEGIFGYDPMI